LTDRGLAKRITFHTVPALSFVPDALAPPNGCCPTTDAAAAAGASLGLDVLLRGQRDNGSGFIYFDTLDQAGVVLLARKTPGPAA
jgi:hypothetical protein